MDVVSVGRVSVDLYAQETLAPFSEQQSFTKSIGGSPTNVAVACARLGLKTLLATKVGSDGFGQYVKNKLTAFGVDISCVGETDKAQTPLAFAALTPPETPTIMFYRSEDAPDTSLQVSDVPAEIIKETKILWISQSALAKGSTAITALSWMKDRNRKDWTVLDLDYRPTLWASKAQATASALNAISLASVVVGNLEECEVAFGSNDASGYADELLANGVQLAIIKLGSDGVLLASKNERVTIAPTPVEVVCGLGAGDAFGGALCYGLIQGWDLERIGAFANAAGALVATKLTCADAMPTIVELEKTLRGAA